MDSAGDKSEEEDVTETRKKRDAEEYERHNPWKRNKRSLDGAFFEPVDTQNFVEIEYRDMLAVFVDKRRVKLQILKNKWKPSKFRLLLFLLEVYLVFRNVL